MTYDPIFMLTVFKLKDKNYSLNNIVKHLKVEFNHEEKTPKKSIIGTLSYMPAMFGCTVASVVIRDLIAKD